MTQPTDTIAQDKRYVRKAALTSVVGYGVKVASPLLFFVVVRFYGAERLGIFAIAQAITLLGVRITLMGLHRSMLWWIPRPEYQEKRQGPVGSMLIIAAFNLIYLSLMLSLGAKPIAAFSGIPEAEDTLRIMAVATMPLAFIEFLCCTLTAHRQLIPQIIVNEGLIPIIHAGLAILFFFTGAQSQGLFIAFAASAYINLLIVLGFAVHTFQRQGWPRWQRRMPTELLRYTWPQWVSEMNYILISRLDVYALGQLTDPATTGIYAAALRVANVIRSVRQSLSPMALAIFSESHASQDTERMRSVFSETVATVLFIQAPVFLFIINFSPWILKLFGPEFERGVWSLTLLSWAWMINGIAGLNDAVIMGASRSFLGMLNNLATLAIQALLLWVLIPWLGIEGAALAVGASFAAVGIMQLVQARRLYATNLYSRQAIGLIGLVFSLQLLSTVARFKLIPPDALEMTALAFIAEISLGALLWRWIRNPSQQSHHA